MNPDLLTDDHFAVLGKMGRAGGGWYPLRSTWNIGDSNKLTHRLCKELASLGYVECVGGDPDGEFVCDWRITSAGLAAVQAAK